MTTAEQAEANKKASLAAEAKRKEELSKRYQPYITARSAPAASIGAKGKRMAS